MKRQTYIKLYRKILENETLIHDHNAFIVFIWLLLRADINTGKVETGRFVIAQQLGLNPNTIYSSLLRLSRNHKLVNISSNNRFSVISIIKYHKYNGVDNNNDNNKITTRQQQDNTIQEVENIRIKEYLDTTTNLEDLKTKFPLITTNAIKREIETMNDWLASNGKAKKDYQAFARNWIRRSEDKLPKKPAPQPIREIDHEKASAGREKLSKLREQFKIGGN